MVGGYEFAGSLRCGELVIRLGSQRGISIFNAACQIYCLQGSFTPERILVIYLHEATVFT